MSWSAERWEEICNDMEAQLKAKEAEIESLKREVKCKNEVLKAISEQIAVDDDFKTAWVNCCGMAGDALKTSEEDHGNFH